VKSRRGSASGRTKSRNYGGVGLGPPNREKTPGGRKETSPKKRADLICPKQKKKRRKKRVTAQDRDSRRGMVTVKKQFRRAREKTARRAWLKKGGAVQEEGITDNDGGGPEPSVRGRGLKDSLT